MARLIDAEPYDELLELRSVQLRDEIGSLGGAVSGCRKLLAIQPTIDAVPVVRCKDCKYSYGNKYCTNDAWKDEGNTVHIEPEDFCSYGERKEV